MDVGPALNGTDSDTPPHWLFEAEYKLLESAPDDHALHRFAEVCAVYERCAYELTASMPMTAEGEVGFTARQYAVAVCTGRIVPAARAIGVLIGVGYVEEAKALLRRLYEIQARTAWIAQVEDDSRAKAWIGGRAKWGRSLFQAAAGHEGGEIYGKLSSPIHGDADELIDYRGVAEGSSLRSMVPTRRIKEESSVLGAVTVILSIQLMLASRVMGEEPPSSGDWERLSAELLGGVSTLVREDLEGLEPSERRDRLEALLADLEAHEKTAAEARESSRTDNDGTVLEE